MTQKEMREITERTKKAFEYSMNEGAEETFRREQKCRERIEKFNSEQARLASLPQSRMK